MLVSGGKIIAIDEIKTTSATLSGDGIWTELGLNTSATIDPIKNDISSLSSTITNISGDLYNLSGDVVNISGDLYKLSGDVTNISGDLYNLSGDVINISGDLYNLSGDVTNISGDLYNLSGDVINISGDVINISGDLYNLSGDVTIISGDLYNLSGDVYNISSNVNIISGDLIEVSSKVEENYTYITALSSDIDFISGELDAETSAREADVKAIEEDIDYLSAEIDTKQKQLSAGKYIEILSGDEYDTITVTGIEDNDTTYFNAKYNRGSSSEYFTFDGSALSASPKVAYFNICLNYKIDTNNTCVDNYYSASVLCNNRVIDSHYLFGAIPSETYNYSKNVLNDAYNNLYKFTFEQETGLNVKDMNITCIGFINDLQTITIDVLGDRGDLLTFGNTLLRV